MKVVCFSNRNSPQDGPERLFFRALKPRKSSIFFNLVVHHLDRRGAAFRAHSPRANFWVRDLLRPSPVLAAAP